MKIITTLFHPEHQGPFELYEIYKGSVTNHLGPIQHQDEAITTATRRLLGCPSLLSVRVLQRTNDCFRAFPVTATLRKDWGEPCRRLV